MKWKISWLEPTGNLVRLFIIALTSTTWFLFLDLPAECVPKAERDEKGSLLWRGEQKPQLLWWSESCLVVWVKAESSWEAHVVSDPSAQTRSLVKP